MIWKDCYCLMHKGILSVGNAVIDRKIRIDEEGMTPFSLTDRKNANVWIGREEECLHIPNPFGRMNVRVEEAVGDHGGLSDEHLEAHVIWENDAGERLERIFEVYPEIAMIHMRMLVSGAGSRQADKAQEREYSGMEAGYAQRAKESLADADTIDALPLPMGHFDLSAIRLIDKSDRNDTLVRKDMRPIYNHGWGSDEAEGNLFIIGDRLDGNAVMMVKEAPVVESMLGRTGKDFCIRENRAALLKGTGLNGQTADGEVFAYGSTIGMGRADSIVVEWRRLYRAMWHGKKHVRIMSNTWGDRNQDKAVCHEFMLREIDRAHELGVQVVQIDDGWQQGLTANSALGSSSVWEGYYAANPDFWQVNRKKFPDGLKPVADYAAEKGIELGLWFSPDSSNDFANWRRDADVLMSFFRELGVRRFKLDGVKIRTKKSERNYLRLLETLNEESGGAVCVNQDITAEIRLGQIYYREYGNLFVENRYTDFASYYPHNTLKNLWQLSEFIPAGKMQFECLNRARNQDKYSVLDPLAPEHYDMDYLFAAVMAASPLIWMEMSHLNEEDAGKLKEIIAAYRPHQERMALGDVRPIGMKPDGRSFTGFDISLGNAGGYLILLREWTEKAEFLFCIPGWEGRTVRIRPLKTNAGAAEATAEGAGARLRTDKPRAYLFAEYKFEGM